jgi:hypothetical protein
MNRGELARLSVERIETSDVAAQQRARGLRSLG